MESPSKAERTVGGVAEPALTEEQFIRRCRAVKVADALALVTEAKVLDRGDGLIGDHLEIAMTGLLDALSILAEREGAQ